VQIVPDHRGPPLHCTLVFAGGGAMPIKGGGANASIRGGGEAD
jgi:hypothetical protein